jgi:voltage-gated potassium channel
MAPEPPGTSRLGRLRPELSDPLGPFVRRMETLVLLILALLVFGTAGFVITEGTSVGFGFVWALDTIATVGSIPEAESTGGQIVKVGLIVLGVGTLFYALVTVTEFFVAGHLADLLADRRARRMIETLDNHHLICGFGRVGRQVARDLRAAGRAFVVIDENPDSREHAEAIGAPYLEGSPSDDRILQAAGVERAVGVIACVDSDAENIFITLTVRELRPDITIVARASVEDSEKKLRRAGANRVVSPYKASGAEMTRLALHPQIAGVVDVAPEFRMEEIEVTVGCQAAGRKVGDIRGSSYVVALRHPDGSVLPQPGSETTLEPGDVLLAMGHTGALERLEQLLAPAQASA